MCELQEKGEVDQDAGEFWVANPFQMQQKGHNLSAYERNRVFLNAGGDEFLDASFTSGCDIDSDSRSAVVGDFNGDHVPDLLVGNVGGGPLRLFLNRAGAANNRVRIELTGTESNRSAIGTRVTLHIGERRIVRDVFPMNGFQGQSPPELIIGVGHAEGIDRIALRWPTGKTQEFTDLPSNATLRIEEGAEQPQIEVWTTPTREKTES